MRPIALAFLFDDQLEPDRQRDRPGFAGRFVERGPM
jgi:hypothetical protein